MTPASRLRLLTDVGAVRYLSREELRWPATLDHGWIDEVWRVCTSQFDGIVLAWGDDPAVRTGLQDILGLTQLPRLWRPPSLLRSHGETGPSGGVAGTGLERLPPAQLWRPVMAGLQEFVAQSERLDGLLPRHAPGPRVLIGGTA